jgi:HlyD family secretion protein
MSTSADRWDKSPKAICRLSIDFMTDLNLDRRQILNCSCREALAESQTLLMPKKKRRIIGAAVVIAIGVGGWLIWQYLQPKGLPEGFASGNGRIEGTEVDVATKLAGRVAKILVNEGDFVTAGQVVAQMDTAVLDAQLAQAKAQLRQAQNAQNTAALTVTLRESEKATANATVDQRQAELTAADRRFSRTEALAKTNVVTPQQLDDDRAATQSAQAALVAARSQVISTEAGIQAAKSQVIEAESAVEAAKAAAEALTADIQDSQLRAPRSGRVQYRVAQTGEVLSAGGRVLNLVDLGDVYMTFFLPTRMAGRVGLGREARLILDAWPDFVIPAQVSFVADVAQFTPKTVETASEREKLMFRIRARIDPELLQRHIRYVKTGLPGMAYVRLNPKVEWPTNLQTRLPQ